jgi:hypothetical protein
MSSFSSDITRIFTAPPSMPVLPTMKEVTDCRFCAIEHLPSLALDHIASYLRAYSLNSLNECSSSLYSMGVDRRIVPGLRLPLYPHQCQSLTWLAARERGVSINQFGGDEPIEMKTSEAMEGTWRGGLLCDEPGLGKTITVLAAILRTAGQETSHHELTESEKEMCCQLSWNNTATEVKQQWLLGAVKRLRYSAYIQTIDETSEWAGSSGSDDAADADEINATASIFTHAPYSWFAFGFHELAKYISNISRKTRRLSSDISTAGTKSAVGSELRGGGAIGSEEDNSDVESEAGDAIMFHENDFGGFETCCLKILNDNSFRYMMGKQAARFKPKVVVSNNNNNNNMGASEEANATNTTANGSTVEETPFNNTSEAQEEARKRKKAEEEEAAEKKRKKIQALVEKAERHALKCSRRILKEELGNAMSEIRDKLLKALFSTATSKMVFASITSKLTINNSISSSSSSSSSNHNVGLSSDEYVRLNYDKLSKSYKCSGKAPSKATLLIVPRSLIHHWKQQIQ